MSVSTRAFCVGSFPVMWGMISKSSRFAPSVPRSCSSVVEEEVGGSVDAVGSSSFVLPNPTVACRVFMSVCRLLLAIIMDHACDVVVLLWRNAPVVVHAAQQDVMAMIFLAAAFILYYYVVFVCFDWCCG